MHLILSFCWEGEQIKLQQKVFPPLLVAGCTLLLRVLIRKYFLRMTLSRLSESSSVLLCGGGGRRERGRQRLSLKGENNNWHRVSDNYCLEVSSRVLWANEPVSKGFAPSQLPSNLTSKKILWPPNLKLEINSWGNVPSHTILKGDIPQYLESFRSDYR